MWKTFHPGLCFCSPSPDGAVLQENFVFAFPDHSMVSDIHNFVQQIRYEETEL